MLLRKAAPSFMPIEPPPIRTGPVLALPPLTLLRLRLPATCKILYPPSSFTPTARQTCNLKHHTLLRPPLWLQVLRAWHNLLVPVPGAPQLRAPGLLRVQHLLSNQARRNPYPCCVLRYHQPLLALRKVRRRLLCLSPSRMLQLQQLVAEPGE